MVSTITDIFDGLIGQDGPKKILSAALTQNKLPQTLVFAGPRGVGKKTAARILANHLQGSQRSYQADTFWFSEMLAQIREREESSPVKTGIDRLLRFMQLSPLASSKKVAIIDNAEELTTEAQNALLKTLEEPHSDTVLILIVEQENILLPTILSRSQVIKFSPLDDVQIKSLVPEVSEEVLSLANGSLGFVKEFYSEESETQEMFSVWQKMDELSVEEILAVTEKMKERSKALEFLNIGLMYHHAKLGNEAGNPEAKWVERIEEATSRIKSNVNPRLAMDALLLVQKGEIW